MFSIASAKTESKPPETVEITQEEVDRYYPTWSIWRATNRKFLPYSGGFLEQPERLMLALITMDSVFARMELQVHEQEKKKREDK